MSKNDLARMINVISSTAPVELLAPIKSEVQRA